ncbi:MAG: hypothetical protein DMD91_19865 [Candidatus Rokuibacteriota bacterium]|nr:MAG: hypothetical protein DMD91_19865 [Candidatus Rokubacteria bacterium]
MRSSRDIPFGQIPGLRSGLWLAFLAVTVWFVTFLGTLKFPLLSPIGSVDEQLNYYQVARNFLTYGFLNSGFLQDLSTSADPAQHPYIYNHMPPGPEIFVALLFKLFGEQYALVRVIFALLFLVGIACYFRFAGLLLRQCGLGGGGYTVLFLSGPQMLKMMDHPAFSLSPLFAYYPVVSLHSYYQTGKRRHLYLALAVVLLGSLYELSTIFVSLALGWLFLSTFRVIRFDRVHLAMFIVTGVAGIMIHLAQTAITFGPLVLVRELSITLSNRIFGVPTPDEVREFYRAHDIVLHGLHHIDLDRWLRALGGSLRFPARLTVLGLALLVVLIGLQRIRSHGSPESSAGRPPREDVAPVLEVAMSLAKLWGWAVVMIVFPFVMFPAYATDYGLGGHVELYWAIGAAAVLAYAVRAAASGWPDQKRVSLASGAITLALLVCLLQLAYLQGPKLQALRHYALARNPYEDLAQMARYVRGSVVMTNTYPVSAGFFSRNTSFGGCGLSAVDPDGRVVPSRCFAAFIRGYGRDASPRIVPSRFVLFKHDVYIGMAQCMGACLAEVDQRLARHHRRVFESDLYTVFELTHVERVAEREGL